MTQPPFGNGGPHPYEGQWPGQEPTQLGPLPQNQGAKRKKWPWIVGAVVALFVAIGLASGGGTDEPSTAASSQPVVETRTVTVEPTPSSTAQQPTTEEIAEQVTTAVAPPPPAPETRSPVSSGVRNAASSASDYLSFSAFSRSGLIKQLEFEDFSTADATAGVDSLDVDWMEQAEKSAKNYLDLSSFSQQGLVEQLVFEGFTESQAQHGAQSQY
ncbi:Ltp family lipoprotein [Williamsia sp. MIQD14]|uniref:Ltp family lipoprotein n=1 Tax=Williamsia sp. MIQD14 TaxID=3425703 RepID=UPI003DA153D7